MIPVGLTLQPDAEYLELLGSVFEDDADYFEVAPETTWRPDGAGVLVENGYHARFAAVGERWHKPFVAHGVGFSIGSPGRAAHRRRWLARLALDQARFRYLWYTDHLGATSLGGDLVALPLPLPMTAHAAQLARRSLRAMQGIVADVGVENTVTYFVLGDPLDEPAFLARVVDAPRTHLLLDLHNVFTMAQNLGFEPEQYLERLDLGRVVEIHLSGGSPSDRSWLPSGRSVRLDAHDSAVPEEVFRLFERYAPRCTSLRGVTLERMEGTVGPGDVVPIREELARARALAHRLGGAG